MYIREIHMYIPVWWLCAMYDVAPSPRLASPCPALPCMRMHERVHVHVHVHLFMPLHCIAVPCLCLYVPTHIPLRSMALRHRASQLHAGPSERAKLGDIGIVSQELHGP